MLAGALLAAVSVAAAEPPVKTPIRGLVSMGAYRFVARGGDPVNTLEPLNAKPGIFGGIVVIATWKQLQETATSGLADNNAIDRALADVREYNRRNPAKPLAVKLRVWAGFEAPDWAKNLGAGPITVTRDGHDRVLGHFWGPPYRKAWSRFQELLAARYDQEPLIHEVAVTSCMSFTAEPFVIPGEEPALGVLRAAGLKDEPYRQCLAHAVDDYAPWKTTLVEFPLNPFRATDTRPWKSDHAFTEQVMRSCRASLGKRCIFDNHNLDANPPENILPIYEAMRRLGPPVEFQTYRETPGDFEGTIRKGLSLGASSIELWQDFRGFPLLPDETLRRWASMLEE